MPQIHSLLCVIVCLLTCSSCAGPFRAPLAAVSTGQTTPSPQVAIVNNTPSDVDGWGVVNWGASRDQVRGVFENLIPQSTGSLGLLDVEIPQH